MAVEESDGVDVGGGGGGGPPGDPLEGHVRVEARLVDAGLVTGRSCAARASGNSRRGSERSLKPDMKSAQFSDCSELYVIPAGTDLGGAGAG